VADVINNKDTYNACHNDLIVLYIIIQFHQYITAGYVHGFEQENS